MCFDKDLFINYWHLICHKNELLNDGDFLRFDTPIGDVVLLNDLGNIIAFDNKCPHRGAKFFKEDFGNRIISCSYHRWAYRNSKVIIPDRNRFIGCDIDDIDLNKYKIEWCEDFIFLGIQPRFKLSEQLGSVAEDTLNKISISIDKRFDFSRYDFECYWAIAMENSLDSYHTHVVHAKTLQSLKPDDVCDFFGRFTSVMTAPIGNEKIKKQLLSLNKFFNVSFQSGGYSSIYMFPFSMISTTFGYSYSLQNFFPPQYGNNYTKFTSRLFGAKITKESYSDILKSFFDSAAELNRRVFIEDHEICKTINYSSWTMEPLKYASDLEMRVVHFRKMCQESTRISNEF